MYAAVDCVMKSLGCGVLFFGWEALNISSGEAATGKPIEQL